MSIVSVFKKRTSVDSIVAVFHEMVDKLRVHVEKLDANEKQIHAQLSSINIEKTRAEVIINKLKGIVQ